MMPKLVDVLSSLECAAQNLSDAATVLRDLDESGILYAAVLEQHAGIQRSRLRVHEFGVTLATAGRMPRRPVPIDHEEEPV